MSERRIIPFEYVERAARLPAEPNDPVNSTVTKLRAEQAGNDILRSPPPDTVARVTRLSRDEQIPPPMVEGREDEIEQSQRVRTFTDLVSRSSVLGRWAVENPRGAVAASDDTENLGMLGNAWADLKRLPARAAGSGGWRLGEYLSETWNRIEEAQEFILSPVDAAMGTFAEASGLDVFDPRPARNAAAEERQQRTAYFRDNAQAVADANRGSNWISEGLLAGTESAPMTLAAVLSRDPKMAASIFGVTSGSTAYGEARRQGVDAGTAFRYGFTQGAIEGGTELIPASTLVDLISRKLPWGTAFVRELGQEMTGEQVATVLQDLNDYAFLPENANKTLGDYIRERPDAAIQTALGVVGGTAVTTGTIGAAQRASDATARIAERVGQAGQARAERQFFDRAERAAEGSKLRTRDPEAFRQLVRQQAEDAGAASVFIPGEAVRAFQQSDSYDRQDDPFARFDVAEAFASGGDIVVPIEDFLTDIVGTQAWQAVREDVRLTAGGLSSREAATFEEAMDGLMAELGDQAAAQDAEQAAQRTTREKIVDRVAEMFGVSFTSPAARDIAEVFASRAETRASRLGQELSESSLDGLQVRQVMPEGVAEAVKADKLDLVINAMRKRGAVEIGEGPTLLDFIRERGGINDTGGDLASMGVPARMLRDFDPRQTAMDGISGEGDFGVDTTLRAAIEAGYFPELAGVENEAGPSTLDTQALLDALAEEVAGRPRYAQVREDATRAAADDLRAMLEDAGLSPDSMNDAEVRAAVEAMANEDAGGRSYEQPAFHGSPHIFDRFSLDAMGTGEGAQVYGWGLYFAGRKEIAQFYKNTLSKPKLMFDGEEIVDLRSLSSSKADWVEALAAKMPGSIPWYHFPPILTKLREDVFFNGRSVASSLAEQVGALKANQPSKMPNTLDERQAVGQLAAARALKESGKLKAEGAGRLYEVEIPEDAEYLLWDKPLSEQPEKVKAGFDAALARINTDTKEIAEIIFEDGDIGKLTGQRIYQKMIDLIPHERSKLEAGGFGDDAWGRTDMIASRLLHEAGVAGIKYLDGGSRTAGDGSFNYVVFDDSRISIRAYEQEARGRIVFDQNARIIELFQSRNLSTPLHELSHMWLEELAADASLPDAPDQLKADWATVKRYFAANGHKIGKDGQIPTEAHELWARSGERYFMEGKAPSSALVRLFETFRGWLVNIYRTVDRLRAPITPEIREVFDRLLATDEEIAAASDRQALGQLFKDAADIGMTQPEFEAYQRQVDDARAGAHASLLDKTMAAIRRRETERYREARKGVRAEQQERIDASPLFKALAAMKAERVSKEWIADNLGVDALDLLPVRVPPLYVAGGVDPNIIAELSGYAGGEAMLESIIGAERRHRELREVGDKRSMRERAIETATDEEMARRWGDPLNDGSIEREALAAVHSEMQGEVIASELRVLARRTGRRPTPYVLAREWARGKVRAGTVAQEASLAAIQRYARNAAKAGREAEKAMLAQDAGEAYRQKQFQMLNNALVSEAKAAHDEVTAAVRRMDKVARSRTRKSVDQDYLEQAQALLEAVDLRKRSQIGIDRQGKWEAFAAARQAEGFDVVVPASFEATIGREHWSRLSTENLLALDEAVKQVMHLGRLKQSLLDNQEQREWDEIYREAEAAGDRIGRKPPEGSFTEPGWWDSVKHGVATADAALLKMETVFDWMDDGDSNGVFNRIAFRPIADAQAREQEMLTDYYARIAEAMKAVPAATLRRWGDKVQLDLLDPETGLPAVMTRQKIVAMALNWGNAGNRQRLADGYGWSPQGIEAALMGNLNEAEWQFVQQVWDIIETLWPNIEAMERAINGIAPEKVEPAEIVTPFGSFRGGYYPAIYDSTLDYSAEEQAGRKADLFEVNYIRATTRASATKDRMEKVSRPILLDLGVINRHLGEVIHDVTHREPVMRAWRFLTNRRVMKAVDESLGREAREQFRPWMQHVANSWASERSGNEGIGRFMSKMRANTTVVGMGWRFTTMLTQLAGYSNSIEYVGIRHLPAAIARFAAHPIATTHFVMDRSDEVRHRMANLDRDVRAELRRLAEPETTKRARQTMTAAKEFAFHNIGYMDRLVSVPTWLAAYNKALEAGMTEEDARYAGDKAVRLSQGAAGPKDLAAVQRGKGAWGEALKLMTMFYSYMSAFYQRQRRLGRDVRRASAKDIPNLVARAWWLIVVPPLLAELLSGRGPDDDEDEAWWAFRAMLGQSLGPIPLVRDVVAPAWDRAVGNPSFGYRFTPAQGGPEAFVRVAGDVGNIVEGEETKRATRNAMELVGYSTGLVPGQIASSTQFLVDIGHGEADPETLAEWYEGLTKGRIAED
jgi:hypothetical protein